MKKINLFLSAFVAITLLSCSSDDDASKKGENPEPKKSKFIIASTPIASEGVADYLLTTETLTEGKISSVGNGVEQDGTYRYYITNNNKFFSLLYGQGNPGAVTTYGLNTSGELVKTSDFQSETVQAFASVNDEVLLMKIPRSGEPNASWYRLDTNNSEFVAEGKTDIVALADNGERAHFTWLTQVGEKVYAPYMSIKGCCDDTFGTNFSDTGWITVFDYPSMEVEKVIKDPRISFIGSYFNSGLTVDEKGDAYAFSYALARTNGEFSSTKKAAITRIKKGTTEFDDYYYDLEEASGGKFPGAIDYVGNGKYIVYFNTEKSAWGGGSVPALVDVYNKTLVWVSDFPTEENIEYVANGIGNTFLSDDKKKFYVGVTTNEDSAVYEIDTDTAIATKGLLVEGGEITAISRLTVEN